MKITNEGRVYEAAIRIYQASVAGWPTTLVERLGPNGEKTFFGNYDANPRAWRCASITPHQLGVLYTQVDWADLSEPIKQKIRRLLFRRNSREWNLQISGSAAGCSQVGSEGTPSDIRH